MDYWVYTPAGYENQAKLPAIYLLDGNDFVMDQKGALPIVLDNLIASGRVRPVLAVFVDPREPGHPQNNRREPELVGHPLEHARFLAEELRPAIDMAYRTDPRPEARVIAGVSYGGLSATYVAATQWQTFRDLAAFSPSLWALRYPDQQPNAQQKAGIRLMQPSIQSITQCGGTSGLACPRLPLKIFLTWGLPNWDVGDLSGLAGDLLQQGYPVSLHPVREARTWSQWRGLLDEMLAFFFSAN